MLFSTLGIIVTYKCNAMCDSCGPRCGPHRKEKFTFEEIKEIIDQATEAGSKLICFTGGEPTLLGPRLEELIAYATEKGNLTRIVTNGWWAKTPESARRRLQSFIDAGLTELNISADDWHLPYVPLECVKNGYDASLDLGIRIIVAVGETRKSKITTEFLQEYLGGAPVFRDGVDDPLDFKGAVRKSWILPFGFGGEKIPQEDFITFRTEPEAVKRLKQQGCPLILNSPAILPDGRVTACCSIFNEDNHSLVMGYWPQQSLKEIMQAGENDLLYNWIKFEGPYGIKDFIQKRAPEIPFKEEYAGICHLCGDLLERSETRTFLEEHMHEMRDHIVMLKLRRLSGLNMPLGCIESRMKDHEPRPRRPENLTQLSYVRDEILH
jgi:hypothetical protein